MQPGGERYGMGAAEMHTYVPAVSGPGGTGADRGSDGAAHLFGHQPNLRGSGDLADLHTLQLPRATTSSYQQEAAEQQYLEQLSTHQHLRGSHSCLQHAALQAHHSLASFFKAAAGVCTHPQEPADKMSLQSFFHMAPPEQNPYKLPGCHGQQQLQLENAAVKEEASAASAWRSDEMAALLQLCSDVDPASTVAPAVWDGVARRQEAARLDREQQLRAQELSMAASRNAALIAFLERATGQSLSIAVPKIAGLPSPLSSAPASASAANAYVQQQPPAIAHSLFHRQAIHDASDMDNSSDAAIKRWPKVEVHTLIRLRSGMDPRFRESGPKAHLWQEISASMACLGFARSPKRCKEKWENINKYFKKTKDSSKRRPENAKTCPYFHQLDTLYQRGILTSSSCAGTNAKLIGNSDSVPECRTQEYENGLSMQNAEEAMHYAKDANLGGIQTAEQQTRDKELRHNQVDKFFHQHTAGLSMHAASKKSLQVELFVKDVLDLQQQQHQKLVEEYDRMEQAQELRDLEKQQIKAASTLSLAHGGTHDSATLMALAHKLVGDSSDLSMSAPSSID